MMAFLSDLSQVVTENEPLAPHTWYGLGGPARWFVRPSSAKQLCEVIRRCRQEGVEHQALGLGANLLVSDEGVDGVVVRLNAPEFRWVQWGSEKSKDSGPVTIVAGGGVDVGRLTIESIRRGLTGLEGIAGIPGTLGGVIRMNAGGHMAQIADVVREVTVVDQLGRLQTLTREEVGFRYRATNLGQAVVCRATLTLQTGDPKRIQERFIDVLRQKKRTQPLSEPTAGCVFKNPPSHSAGELIDRAGLKGHSVGGAYVSNKHANFILVKDGVTAGDVLTLIGQIRREVAQQFAVELELEVEVWGRQHIRHLEAIAQ